MDPEERKRLRERKRLMRKQRREFLSEERRSIRRQKHELNEQKASMRMRIRQARMEVLKRKLSFPWKIFFTNNSTKKSDQKAEEPPAKLYYDWNWEIKDTPTSGRQSFLKNDAQAEFSTEKKENITPKEKRKLLKKQRREFLAEERRSLKRERRQMRRQKAIMRRKINTARVEGLRKEFGQFIKQPFRTGETDETDKRIRKRIKREIRQQNLKNINHIPLLVIHSISRFWQNRFRQLANAGQEIKSFSLLVKLAFGQYQLRRDYIKTFLNSVALFLLSFLLVYYVHQFATILTARAFSIPTKLYSYRIDWPLYTYSYLYSRRALIVIFGMGPLLCLLMGIGAYRLFLAVRFRTVFLKSFLLWIAFHAFNLFFGAYIVGVITRTGFIYTSEWLFLSNVFDVEEIIFMIVSIIVLIIAGYYSTRQFLYASDSSEIIEPRYRVLYLICKVLIPWLSGTLILFAVNIPKNPLELVMLYGTSALIVFPIFSNFNTTTMQMLKLPRVPNKFRVGWVYIFITIAAIFATRLLLRSGISFY